jgi:hypothetical protein
MNPELYVWSAALLAFLAGAAWLIMRAFGSWLAIPAVVGTAVAVPVVRSRLAPAARGAGTWLTILSGALVLAAVAGVDEQHGEGEEDRSRTNLRNGVEACLDGRLPANVDAATGSEFCNIVDDVGEDAYGNR